MDDKVSSASYEFKLLLKMKSHVEVFAFSEGLRALLHEDETQQQYGTLDSGRGDSGVITLCRRKIEQGSETREEG